MANKERFGIAEWYGKDFTKLTSQERMFFSDYKRRSGPSATELGRLQILQSKGRQNLTENEKERLEALEYKLKDALATNIQCPFRFSRDPLYPVCTKSGGVCSMRLYSQDSNGKPRPISGDRGALRILCPYRFYEANIIFQHIGKHMFGNQNPTIIKEVGFLEGEGSIDSEGGDVGKIDMVLVSGDRDKYDWCACELQAVYFSGHAMRNEFRAIKVDISKGGNGYIFPQETRRPDYRSSGPKRLMPQLQIKVPTLRRWGKKMAVVIDEAFFKSLGTIRRVDDVSNADIVWFVVRLEDTGNGFTLVPKEEVYATLEHSVEGLTGGEPLPKHEFERRLLTKLGWHS